VRSDPPGARVRVDGQVRGQTPLELVDLGFGSHEVRIELKGYDTQVRTAALSAEAPAAELRVSLARSAPATGTADIVSTPPGASVAIDGKPSGRTPLSAVPLRPGSRRVDVTLDGHEPWSGAVDVAVGRRANLDVRLRPIPAPEPEPTPEEVDPARVYGQGDVDTPPKRRTGESPSYPRSGAPRLKSGERVSVTVRFVVTEKGDVEDVAVVESAGKVVDAVVVQAVRSWKYEPATKRGVRVRSQMVLKQTFLGG
jgi:TonB family protein